MLRVICVTIEQSYNRGCTIARWLRRSLLKRKVPTGCLQADRREADPLYRGLIISTDYDCGQRFTPERMSRCANASTRERGEHRFTGLTRATPGQGLRIKRHHGNFSVVCPWQESNPWGSVLRVICVTIEQSYNRGCTIAQWLRKSLLTRNPTGSILARDTLRKSCHGGA